jgi:spermidine synthase
MNAPGEQATLAPLRARQLVLAAVGALGASCVMTQLALMRELLGAFAGNEMVLGVGLGLWLLLMGIGTWLGRASQRFGDGLAALAVTQMLVAVLPMAQVFLLRALRNVVFIRGAEVGVVQTVAATFVLLLPYCLVAGFSLTLACSILAREEGPRGIGRVYVADSIGSIVGGVLFSFVLVPRLDHLHALLFPGLLNLMAAAALGLRVQRVKFAAGREPAPPGGVSYTGWGICGLAAVLGIALVTTAVLTDLDDLSTRLQYPGQHIIARANSPYGKWLVTESDGQFDFIENGLPFTSTRDDQHVEETVHYALAQRPDARRVLLICGGVSGTASEILKYHVREVDYVELDPLLLSLARRYLPQNLADPRIRVIYRDGRAFLRQCAEGAYDVIITDVPGPSNAQLNRFYTVEFLAELKRALAKDGVVSFTLGQYENYVSPDLVRMLSSFHASLKRCFRNVLLFPGGRVYFVASDGPLFPDIAGRLEQRQIKTKLVNRHYLEATLTPDRMADIVHAATQPAAVNSDFNPVLYYYHLRHWMSQFDSGFGPFQIPLLILLGIYLVWLRGAAFALFASGFAGSALEVVLLLAFQIFCGSVYYQVGIIVTAFMLGLAVGAWRTNRKESEVESSVADFGRPAQARGRCGGEEQAGKRLARLAFTLAAGALLLPLLLRLLSALGATTVSLLVLKAIIALLTLMLGALVGMQFPLANQLEFDGSATGASRLYTADFIGACLGALLACTLLIPLVGVAGVCLLTALLNVVGGVGVLRLRSALRGG